MKDPNDQFFKFLFLILRLWLKLKDQFHRYKLKSLIFIPDIWYFIYIIYIRLYLISIKLSFHLISLLLLNLFFHKKLLLLYKFFITNLNFVVKLILFFLLQSIREINFLIHIVISFMSSILNLIYRMSNFQFIR